MENKNLEIYNKVRSVPKEALKTIQAGRLKGMSDINPMWRIKMLTEMFGPCGFGWRYEITRMWNESGAAGVISAFVTINLYVKQGDEWSQPIPGIGGSSFVAQEKSGLYTSDECYKMALTDAISVACKSLGMAADVYFANDRTKYTQQEETAAAPQPPAPQPPSDLPDFLSMALQEIHAATTTQTLIGIYNNYQVLHTDKRFMSEMTTKRKQIEKNNGTN